MTEPAEKNVMSKTEMPGGRPTDYRPEYCALVVDFCKEGASLVEFAAHIGVARSTIFEWRAAFPEFSIAASRALTLAQAWHEKKVRDNVHNREFNSRLMEFTMQSRFRDDYSPAQRLEITGANGTPLNQRSLTRDELLALAAPILEAEVVEEKPKELSSGTNPTTQNNPDLSDKTQNPA